MPKSNPPKARVTQEQVELAREVDLLSYLQSTEPQNLRRKGSGYCLSYQDSLSISNGKWYRHSQNVGGRTALDYLMKVRGMGFVDAVETVCAGRYIPSAAHTAPSPAKREFSAPKPYRCGTHAFGYLTRRGISPDIVHQCISKGLLYESRYNGNPVCVFTGKDEHGAVRFAGMRGIGGDFKTDAVGSDKRYSFCFPAENQNSSNLAVFEAPIDALSHATLQEMQGWPWDGHRLSLGGTSPAALISFLERNPQIKRVNLYLDNDKPGLVAARNIRAMLRSDARYRHIRVSICPPRRENDYNAALLSVRREKTEQEQPSRRHHRDGGFSL